MTRLYGELNLAQAALKNLQQEQDDTQDTLNRLSVEAKDLEAELVPHLKPS
jgi:hypothetical protein